MQKALVLNKILDLQFQDVSVPKPGENEVLIETAYVGICGSDVHYWLEGRCGDFILHEPMIMGHETSGVVVKLGSNLKNPLQIGDKVCIEPGIPCRFCHQCRSGRYNLCPTIKFHATPPVDGTLRKYFVHPSDFCYKLPQRISLQLGALIEPLTVAVYAFSRAQFSYINSPNVLISGAGPIGLACAVCALSMGAKNIVITDIVESRLKTAKALGVHHAYQIILLPKTENTPQKNNINLIHFKEIFTASVEENTITNTSNNSDLVSHILSPENCDNRPHVCFEATGSLTGVDLALQVLQPGSKMVCIGFGLHPTPVNFGQVLAKQIDIMGVFRYANCFPQTVELLERTPLNLEKLTKLFITHTFPFEDSVKAYETARDNAKNNAIKVMINVGCK